MTRFRWSIALVCALGCSSEGDGTSTNASDATSEADGSSDGPWSSEEASGPSTGGGSETGSAETGGGGLPDCGFEAIPFDPLGMVLQLESADQSMCVRLERRDEGPGSLANTQWTLLEMQVGPLGSVSLVDDAASLCWYSSHHNFLDWAHAWTGDRHYDLKLKLDGHGGARTYELHTFSQGPLGDTCAPLMDGDAAIGDPVELVPYNP